MVKLLDEVAFYTSLVEDLRKTWWQQGKASIKVNIRALIIRIEFWGILVRIIA